MLPRWNTSRGDEKTRHSFIRNHAKEVWGWNSLTQYTAFVSVACVFVTIETGPRRIVPVNVATGPMLRRVKQQIRDATAWETIPRFPVHDDEDIFGQDGRTLSVEGTHRWYSQLSRLPP